MIVLVIEKLDSMSSQAHVVAMTGDHEHRPRVGCSSNVQQGKDERLQGVGLEFIAQTEEAEELYRCQCR